MHEIFSENRQSDSLTDNGHRGKHRLIDPSGLCSRITPIIDIGIKADGIKYSLMKQMSQYSVNIHEQDFNTLLGYGAIEEVIEGIFVVNDRAQYDENIGLRLDNHWINEILMA